jgi:hypothetical protein
MSIHTPKSHDSSRIDTTELRRSRLTFANSVVAFETGPVGTVARIEHVDGRREYAGPLDEATIAALREVGSE